MDDIRERVLVYVTIAAAALLTTFDGLANLAGVIVFGFLIGWYMRRAEMAEDAWKAQDDLIEQQRLYIEALRRIAARNNN